MRISDWSSDVCSSDLIAAAFGEIAALRGDAGIFRTHIYLATGRIDAERRILREVAPGDEIEIAGAGSDHAARKRVVKGKSVSVRVDLGGRRIIKQKNIRKTLVMPSISTHQHTN